MNPLTNILTPAIRKAVYAVYALVGVAFGAVQVAYGTGAPHWLVVALSVFAFLGTALGLTAASNIAKPDPQNDTDYSE